MRVHSALVHSLAKGLLKLRDEITPFRTGGASQSVRVRKVKCPRYPEVRRVKHVCQSSGSVPSVLAGRSR